MINCFEVSLSISTCAATAGVVAGVPCFTLRRRLAAGEERRLNLFEPRWLALMDRLAAGTYTRPLLTST
jgi:hypothetical protein